MKSSFLIWTSKLKNNEEEDQLPRRLTNKRQIVHKNKRNKNYCRPLDIFRERNICFFFNTALLYTLQ